jgi:hypothetical protein
MELDRRRLLRSIALLGGVGSAGCFGGDTGSPETGTDGGTGTPVGSTQETVTSTPTPDRTPTYTTVCGVCTDPPELLVEAPTPEVSPGATETIAATFRNPYPFAVSDVEVALDAPGTDWTVTPGSVTFETVSPGEERDVTWEVTVPDSATGTHTLTTVTTIRGPRTDYTVRTNHIEVSVADPSG